MFLEVLLVGIKHTIQPRQKLLSAVVSVHDDRDAICWSDGANVVSCGNGPCNGSGLILIVNALASKVRRTTL